MQQESWALNATMNLGIECKKEIEHWMQQGNW